MTHTQSTARRRLLSLAAGTATAALVLAGCGTSGDLDVGGEFTGTYDGPDIELDYWNGFTGGDGPFMQEMVDRFNEEHDNITVVSNTIPWGDFYQALPAALTAGEGPDVAVMHLDQLASFAARQLLLPLDDLTDQLGLSADDFTEEVWSAAEYDGARYGIPLDVHSLAMYYNTEHFEAAGIDEVPTDAESFRAALDALQEAGYDTPFWMPSRWPSHLMNLTLQWQFGGSPYGDAGEEAQFDSEAGIEALAWQRSIIEDGYSPADVAIDTQYVAFKNGETSITWDGIWQINDLEASGLPYAAAPVPTIGDSPAVWANSHNFVIPTQRTSDENSVNAARVFVAWMSEQSGTWAGSGMIPARDSVRSSGVLDDTAQGAIAEQIESMRFLPPVPGIGAVQAETLEIAVADGVLGTRTPDAAMTEATRSANQLLEENRATFGE